MPRALIAPTAGSGGQTFPVFQNAAWTGNTVPYYPLGRVNGTAGSTRPSANITLGDIEYQPFMLGRDSVLAQLAVNVTIVAGAGGVARFGIYDAHPITSLPRTLLTDAAEITTTALNIRSANVTAVTLRAGKLYYVATTFGVAAPTISAFNIASLSASAMVIGMQGTLLTSTQAASLALNGVYGVLSAAAVAPTFASTQNAIMVFAKFSA